MLFARRKGRPGAKAGRPTGTGFRALDSRLPAAEGGALLRKAFPDHWSFLLGEIALYSLVLLVLTGVFLTLFFNPGMSQVPYEGSYEPLRGVPVSEAYASTLRISFDVRGGLLIRQMHHWAALVFVSAIGLHMLRIFFTGAFRKPRELNWVIGLTLFLLAVVEGFCGYSLPDDLLSGTGMRVVQSLLLSIPVVGTYLMFFLFGGEYPGHDIVPRLYVTHILLVPGLLLALVVVHLILVVYLKHTQWGGPGRSNRNVVGKPAFPRFTASSAGLCAMVFGVLALLGGLAQINPVWDYGPYRADQVSTGSQPDWYVGFLEGSLRLMPPFETTLWGHTLVWNVLVPTVILPALLFLCLYLYPFLERWVTGDTGEHHLCDRPRNRPVRTGLGAAGITFYGVLLLAGGNDVVAYTLDISLNALTWVLRVALVAGPVAAFLLTRSVCLGLQAHDLERIERGDETGEVRQSVQGGLDEGRRPLSPRERWTLALKESPRPLRLPEASRARRLRVALSRWFHGG
ncbi:cytochrome bc complex cytochrome b subunit [Streptomyces sp. Ru87]|uniref:cytochrome bc1 complex cytochrome b subunit n=1 Tax=Streptomyces sp. Ru87 TaxID=2044307 RepID=UPI000BF52816|nr:cytochrome bc complex cytochrome b subunit [Streptomyces sp. Ru87]PGH51869.1 ubiquinol-cytochrome c reductase cytochrome b subunit [Streptomyces sp. Ru87]